MGGRPPFILTKIEGISAVNANIQTQKSLFQDGETYIDNLLEARSLSIEIMILAHNAEEMIRNRRKLLQVFNPKLGEGKIIYEKNGVKKEIKAISELAPVFPDVTEYKNMLQPGMIQLFCANPFWQDLDVIKAEIAAWIGTFEFPLEIPIETGIEMGYREPSLIVNIFNKGDVPCGIKIEFKALATVVNPSLLNVNTREYIKINRVMEAGEKITVTTHFQNKRVMLSKNGVTENAFNWIDLGSTFLQLNVGDNLFRYDAEDGLYSLEVSIYYTPQYVGV